jgi:hypothetical protein
MAQNAKRRINSSPCHPVIAVGRIKSAQREPQHSARAAFPPMVRNKAAHPVSGHKTKSEYRRYKFNELDHENLPSLGAR